MITTYIIEPAKRATRAFKVEQPDVAEAMHEAGLSPGQVDFGTIKRDPDTGDGISIVVAEFGMYEPVSQQNYFVISRRLVAGNAVLFAFDRAGKTVEMKPGDLPIITYLNGVEEIEAAIGRGEVRRPKLSITSVDGHGRATTEHLWRWPDPAPPHIEAEKAIRKAR